MRIRYKKKQVKLNFILAIVWLIYGTVLIMFNDDVNWFEYDWFVFSAIYFIMYLYQKKEKYLTIENGIIRQNWPFGKKMNLNEIKRIRYFSGDYILKSEKRKLTINTQLIANESLLDLKSELNKLNAKWI